MKVLVTGGAGYIGGTVAQLLLEAGHTVVVYDNFSKGHRWSVPAGAELVEGELSDRVGLERLFRDASEAGSPFDGVMHFAALIEAGESMRKPELYFRNNTASSLSLLEAMLATGVKRLVFSSTAAVYGDPELATDEPGRIMETAALRPSNPYGQSKLMVERMLEWMGRAHGLRCARLRYFNVAGAIPKRGEAHEPESHLIPLVLDVALGRRANISIFGTDYPTRDGTCVRDYIHVKDVARAHLMAFDALAEKDGSIYNVGNGQGFSVREVIESARRVTGHAIPVIEESRRPGDPAVLVASSEKISAELGWRPEFPDLDAIIKSAWEWHQGRYMKSAI